MFNMLNPEKLLEQRINRVKFFMTTDKLSCRHRRKFVTENVILIIETYYGSKLRVIYEVIRYYLSNAYRDFTFSIELFWWKKVRRLSDNEIEAKISSLTVEEIEEVKNEQNN